MRYSFVLAAVAALESVGESSTNVSVNTEAGPNEAGGEARGSIFGDNGVVAVNLRLSANDVAEEIKRADLPDQVVTQLSGAAENTEGGGKIETEQDLANVAGALGKAAADATANNNATQASSVLASIRGVVRNAMGQSVASDVVIGACVVAASVGEELNVVIKVTMDTIKALQKAAKKPRQPPANCASDICRTAIESVVELLSQGSNHDVAATFLVAIEALGNHKSVNVRVEADFAENVAAVTKIGQVVQTLKLDATAAKQVTDEAGQAAEKLKELPAPKAAASEGDKNVCADSAKLVRTKCEEDGGSDCVAQEEKNRRECLGMPAEAASQNNDNKGSGTCQEQSTQIFDECVQALSPELRADKEGCSNKARDALAKCEAKSPPITIKDDCRRHGFEAFNICKKDSPKDIRRCGEVGRKATADCRASQQGQKQN
ncbi:hypothetical protein HRG_001742 [Hirsutella rhossiliensis]|uniref:Uncharacterized protein n=1 Tax=Hirsutella rhossiliensis TaxID=111463 RepID=A0A9P8SKF9_9HYPO|nr:uncharacterized protein HRG_01742 [Hirsutella rhossiliensis]KAH0966333.1 hypothetical protein HRG_01742 [Hirsutella rhossiliensis]